MNPSERFFEKLRKLTLYLETESSSLLNANQNLRDDDEDEENGAEALYQLHSEVRELKRQVQDQISGHDSTTTELRSFIRRCLVLKERSTKDLDSLKEHFQKYGYIPRASGMENTAINGLKEKKEKAEQAAEKSESTEEARESQQSGTPEKISTSPDKLHTPKLSDFGLSALQIQRVLDESEVHLCPAPVAPVPHSLAVFIKSIPSPLPKTPKCSLQMDEDAPTPRLEAFGISENTMCWNNDFTMDLFNKKPPNKSRENLENAHHLPSSLLTKAVVNDSLESPTPPVFCTPGFKMEKHHAPSSLAHNGKHDLESPPHLSKGTPELPTFETPFLSKNGAGESFCGMKAGLVLEQSSEPVLQGFNQDWCLATPKVRMEFLTEPCTPEMPDISLVTQDILKLMAQCKP